MSTVLANQCMPLALLVFVKGSSPYRTSWLLYFLLKPYPVTDCVHTMWWHLFLYFWVSKLSRHSTSWVLCQTLARFVKFKGFFFFLLRLFSFLFGGRMRILWEITHYSLASFWHFLTFLRKKKVGRRSRKCRISWYLVLTGVHLMHDKYTRSTRHPFFFLLYVFVL